MIRLVHDHDVGLGAVDQEGNNLHGASYFGETSSIVTTSGS